MSEQETGSPAEAPAKKAPKVKLPTAEKRVVRKKMRSERRKTLSAKMKTDVEFKKAYLAQKKTRANARVAAFAKAKKGKK